MQRRTRVVALAVAFLCALGVVLAHGMLAIAGSLFAHFGAVPIALALLLGFAWGAVLVRSYSRIRLELGWVPVGFLLLAILSFAVWLAQEYYLPVVLAACLMGVSAAFAAFPLIAFWRPAPTLLKLAAVTAGCLAGVACFWLPYRPALLGAAISTLLFTLVLFALDREFLIRGGLFLGGRVISGIRVSGQQHVPVTGPALLVSNHVTFIDGFLIGSSLPRLVRFMIFKPYFNLPVARWVFTTIRAIPTSETGPREIVASLKRARAALQEGDLVCIFAEGFITRTGEILPFKRGMDRIVEGTHIPVIPVHLGGLYGRTLSLVGGALVRRWPQRARVPVTISFGPPLPSGATADDARAAVEALAKAASAGYAAVERPPAVVA